MPDTLLTIKAQVDQAVQQFQTLEGRIKGMSHRLEEMGETTKRVGEVFEVFKAHIVFQKLKTMIESVVGAYAQSEQAANQLSAALRQQALPVEALSKKYADIAQKIQTKTAFEDDSIVSGMAVMQSMVGQLEVTEDLTKAIVDFAAAHRMDVRQAFELVGKTIGSSTNALGRYGIEVDQNATRSEKLAAVTAALSDRFRGQAEAQAQGLGSLAQLSNAFGDLQEEIGKKLAPTIEDVARKLTALLGTLKENSFAGFIAGIAAMTGAFAALVLAINAASASWVAFAAAISAHPIGAAITAGVVAITAAIVAWKTNLGGVRDMARGVGEAIVEGLSASAQKIGGIVAGIWMQLKGLLTLDKGLYEAGTAVITKAQGIGVGAAASAGYTAGSAPAGGEPGFMSDSIQGWSDLSRVSARNPEVNEKDLEAAQKAYFKMLDERTKAQIEAGKKAMKEATTSAEFHSALAQVEAAMKQGHEQRLQQIERETKGRKEKEVLVAAERERHERELAVVQMTKAEEFEAWQKKRRAERLEELAEEGDLWKKWRDPNAPLQPGEETGAKMEGMAASLAVSKIPYVGPILAAADKLVGAVQALAQFIPNLITKIGQAITSIIDLPVNIVNALTGIGQAIVESSAKPLQALDKIDELVRSFSSTFFQNFGKLGDRFMESLDLLTSEDTMNQIVEAFPEMLSKIMEQMPKIVRRLSELMSEWAPVTIRIYIREYIKHAPEMARAFAGIFFGGEIIRAASLGIIDAFHGSMAELAAGWHDIIRSLGPSLSRAGGTIVEGFSAVFAGLGSVFMQAGDWIWKGLYQPLVTEGFGLFGGLGSEIWNGFKNLADIMNVFMMQQGARLWAGVMAEATRLGDTLKALGGTIWGGIKEGWTHESDKVRDVGKEIVNGVKIAFSTLGDQAREVGGKIWDGLWAKIEALKDKFKELGRKISDGLKEGLGLEGDTSSFFSRAEGALRGTLGMASGGMVRPLYLASGWVPKASDTVPAMLTPGERVFSVEDNKALIEAIRGGQRIQVVLKGEGFMEELIERALVRATVLGTGRVSVAVGSEA